MKKTIICLVCFYSSLIFAQEPTVFDTMGDNAAATVGEAYQLSGLSDVVGGFAGERLNGLLQQKMKEFASDAFSKFLSDASKTGKFKGPDGKVNVKAAMKEAMTPEMKAKIQETMKQKLKDWLPEVSKKVLYEDLFQGKLLQNDAVKDIYELEQKIQKSLDTTLNTVFDKYGDQYYSQAVGSINSYLSPCPTGKTTGACGFINLNVDVTDLKKTLDSAITIGNVMAPFSIGLSQVIGESTVKGIQSRMEDVLNGELPPEALQYLKMGPEKFAEYAEKAKQYLPGEQLKQVRNKLLGMPLITLPSGAYCGILAGVSAKFFAEFAASCSGFGATCNEKLLERGTEVLNVLIQQAKNKQAISLTLGSFLDFTKQLSAQLGLDKIGGIAKLKGDLSKYTDKLNKLQEMADKIDNFAKSKMDKVLGEMNKMVDELTKELKDFQNELFEPLKNAKDEFGLGLENIKKQIKDAMGNFNGLPTNFDDLKKKLGIPDKPFGKSGDFNPVKYAKDKAGDVLAEINDKVSGGLAKLGTSACDKIGCLGPAAKILDVEEIPAQNPSPAYPEKTADTQKEDEESPMDPVFMHNGEYYLNVTDLTIPGVGLPFEFVRTYRSRSDFLGPLGYNWTHNYAERIMSWDDSPNGEGVTWVDPNGKKYFFKKRTEGVEVVETAEMKIYPKFISPAGVFSELFEVITSGGTEFMFRSPNGSKTFFNKYGLLIKKNDRFGNTLSFVYDDGIKLSKVVDTMGREVKFTYDKIGKITQMADFSGRTFNYTYDSDQDLIGVTTPPVTEFPKGKTTRYRYSTNHNLTIVMDPRDQIFLRNSYGDFGDNKDKVVDQVYGTERDHIKAEYRTATVDESADKMNTLANRVWVTDRRGVTRIYDHNSEGNLLEQWIVEENNAVVPVIWHTYNANGDRPFTYYPSGMWVAREFEGENITKESVCYDAAGGEECRESSYTYEPIFGQMISSKAQDGGLTKYEYTENGALKRVLLPNGGEISYEYNKFGQRTSRTDPLEVVEQYEYEGPPLPQGERVRERGIGYLKKITRGTSGAKEATIFEYDSVGNITAVTNALGHREEYNLNVLNQIVSENGGAVAKKYFYDANDNLSKIVVGDNEAVYEFEYDILDNLTAKKEFLGSDKFIETKYEYDPNENLVKMTFPEGNSVSYSYDVRNRLISSGEDSLVYDYAGNIAKYVSAVGETIYGYNGFGEVVSIKGGAGTEKKLVRDGSGRVTQEELEAPDGKTILSEKRYSYGPLGELTSSGAKLWRDDESKSRFVERKLVTNKRGDVVEEIDQSGFATKYGYDALGRLASSIDALGNVEKRTFNALGLVTSYSKPDETKYFYDEFGRLSSIQTPQKGIKKFTYNSLGNLTEEIDELGNITRYSYDALGRRTAVTQAIGTVDEATTSYEWDGNGRLLSLTDANGNKTIYRYDDRDRLTEERFADGGTTFYAYDAGGRLRETKDQNGNVVGYYYDVAGNLVLKDIKRYDGSVGTTRQEYYYDNLGRLIYSLDNNSPDDPNDDSRVWYSYDSLSRLVAENQNGEWLIKNFDDVGNETVVMNPTGLIYQKDYDALGRLTNVSEVDGQNGTGGTIAGFSYLGADKLVGKTLGNGIRLAQKSGIGGNILEQSYSLKGKNILKPFIYNYNVKDQLVSDGKRQYAYDAMDRLVEARGKEGSTKWDLDKVGNWLARSANGASQKFVPDEMNAYTKVEQPGGASAELKYDKNGNMILDGDLQYKFDALNRLAQVMDKEGKIVAEYKYDVHNRRSLKIVNGDKIAYYYNGWNLSGELTKDGKKDYLYGQGLDDLIKTTRLVGGEREDEYPLNDRTLNVRAVTDRSGKVVAEYDYDAYGNLADPPPLQKGTGSQSPPLKKGGEGGFTGRPADPETGLINLRNRYYSPKLGRFVSRDPMGYVDTPNLYAYVDNSPLMLIDPLGLWANPIPGDNIVRPFTTNGAENLVPERNMFGEKLRYQPNPDKTKPGKWNGHQGLDLIAKVGTPIRAVENGKIVEVGNSNSYGKYITLEYKAKCGTTMRAFYAHLSETSVKVGDIALEGGTIGRTGKTGNASTMNQINEHLHFEIRNGSQTLGTYKPGLKGRYDPASSFTELLIPTKVGADKNITRVRQYGKKQEHDYYGDGTLFLPDRKPLSLAPELEIPDV